MADKRISELVNADALSGAESVEVVQGGVNKKTTAQDIANLAPGAGHVIEDEGTPLTARTKLNFVGAGVTVTDDGGDDATVVTIDGATSLFLGLYTSLANLEAAHATATSGNWAIVDPGPGTDAVKYIWDEDEGWVEGGGGGAGTWGSITGNLPDQTDLQSALDAKSGYSAVTASGTNDYTVTVPSVTALTAGLTFDVVFTNANTLPVPNDNLIYPTLNVNSLGAIRIRTSNNTDLYIGDILPNEPFRVTYDGTYFRLHRRRSGLKVFNVEDYGAVHNWLSVEDGAMTSGSATVTSATANFQSTVTGKYMRVTGAGSGGADLVGTVTYVNVTTVTLSVSASTTVSVAKIEWGSDDTAAIQLAVDAAYAAGGGSIFFPSGLYVIAGALQETSNSNCQIKLPAVDVGDSGSEIPISITFEGEFSPYKVASTIRDVNENIRGTILVGFLNAGSGGAMIGGKRASNAFSNVLFEMKNMVVRMPRNPVLTGVNVEKVVAARIIDSAVDTGNYSYTMGTEPSTSTSYGIKMPELDNGVICSARNVFIIGFYTGLKIAEHFNGDELEIWRCKYGIESPQMNHAAFIQRVTFVWCQNCLRGTGGNSYLEVRQFDIEHKAVTGSWMETVYDVDDSNNYIKGKAHWHAVTQNVGVDAVFTKNGGGYFVTGNMASCNSPGCSVTRTTDQSIPNGGAATAIQFTVERFDNDSMHDNATNNTRITCRTAGTYMIVGQFRFATDSTGTFRQVQIRLNGTTVISQDQRPPMTGVRTFVDTQTIYRMVPGDYVELLAVHDATAAVNAEIVSAFTPVLSMVRLSD